MRECHLFFNVRYPVWYKTVGLVSSRNILDQLFERDLQLVRGKVAVTGKDRPFCRASVTSACPWWAHCIPGDDSGGRKAGCSSH